MRRIDHDAYRVSVRVSNRMFYALMRDVAEFDFTATDGTYNENGFFNTILPAAYKERQNAKNELRSHLEKRFSHRINRGDNKALLSEICEETFAFQCEEGGNEKNKKKLDIRLSVENIKFFSGIFFGLDAEKVSKSEFLRSLLQYYLSMPMDTREYLCYRKQCDELIEFANNKTVIVYNNDPYTEEFFPITVDLCCIDNRYYVIGVVQEGSTIILKAYKLCKFKEYIAKDYKYEIDKMTQTTADKVISDFTYFHKPIYYLRGNGDEANRAEESEAIPAEEYCGE